MERARIHAQEYPRTSLLTSENWGFTLATPVPFRVFIAREPPPLIFFIINFDRSISGTYGDAGFDINGPGLGIHAAGDHYLIQPTVPVVKLPGAWASIVYDQTIL